jgi:alpha-D-ribose 1-methylphosphonate 5-triphosphate diphosphatase
MKTIIINGKIVTSDRVINGVLTVEGNRIASVDEALTNIRAQDNYNSDVEIIDAEGCYVLPGLIDFHCDMLEHAIQPRKGVFFSIRLALQSLQSQFLAAGITTMLHPISFSGEPGLRSNETANEIVREIESFRRKEVSLLRHFIHVRYELFNKTGL